MPKHVERARGGGLGTSLVVQSCQLGIRKCVRSQIFIGNHICIWAWPQTTKYVIFITVNYIAGCSLLVASSRACGVMFNRLHMYRELQYTGLLHASSISGLDFPVVTIRHYRFLRNLRCVATGSLYMSAWI